MQMGNFDHLVKILMIGDSGVGKTCILQRFENGEFKMNHLPTIAIDFSIKTVEISNKRIKMQIWDTAGQERYNTLTAGFFKNTHAVLICFSLIDRTSFESVNRWMQQIQSLAPKDVLIVLIGNKADLTDEIKVSEEETQKLAQEYGLHYFQTSAATGLNIDKAFRSVGEMLIEIIDKNKTVNEEPNSSSLMNRFDKIKKPDCCGK